MEPLDELCRESIHRAPLRSASDRLNKKSILCLISSMAPHDALCRIPDTEPGPLLLVDALRLSGRECLISYGAARRTVPHP